MKTAARYLVPVLLGLLGVLLGQAGIHLWGDHRLVDAIRADINRQQQAAPPRPAAPAEAK